jgi:hypothetical protein
VNAERFQELWKEIKQHKSDRAERMPDDAAALRTMLDVMERLRELGWRDAIYCPKDGTHFNAIEAGSTGIFDCYYDGEWPTGGWWIADGGELYPSRPILFKPKNTDRESA